MKKIGNKESLLASLTKLTTQEIQPNEITADDLVKSTGVNHTTAMRLLREEVKIGKLKCRKSRKNGKLCWAFSEA